MEIANFLSTNGGPHTASQWATQTAVTLCPLDGLTGERREAAEKFRHVVAAVLLTHYDDALQQERTALRTDPKHVNDVINVRRAVDDALHTICWGAQETIWAAHWDNSDVVDTARDILRTHLETAVHVERLWHCDRNQSCRHCQTYKQFFGA
jgi:hypothetical protein